MLILKRRQSLQRRVPRQSLGTRGKSLETGFLATPRDIVTRYN
jgi:hypothetical protein